MVQFFESVSIEWTSQASLLLYFSYADSWNEYLFTKPALSIATVLDARLAEHNKQNNKLMVIKNVFDFGSDADKIRASALLSKSLDEVEKYN